MPGFISVLASGVVHLIVILLMVWSAGQMLDTGVQKVKERLDERACWQRPNCCCCRNHSRRLLKRNERRNRQIKSRRKCRNQRRSRLLRSP